MSQNLTGRSYVGRCVKIGECIGRAANGFAAPISDGGNSMSQQAACGIGLTHLSMLLGAQGLDAELDVQPDGLNQHRPPIVIVGRIVVMLHVERRVEAPNYMRAVVALPKIFGR